MKNFKKTQLKLRIAQNLVQNFSGGLSKEEVNELTQILTENQNEIIRNNQQIKEEIISNLKKK